MLQLPSLSFTLNVDGPSSSGPVASAGAGDWSAVAAVFGLQGQSVESVAPQLTGPAQMAATGQSNANMTPGDETGLAGASDQFSELLAYLQAQGWSVDAEDGQELLAALLMQLSDDEALAADLRHWLQDGAWREHNGAFTDDRLSPSIQDAMAAIGQALRLLDDPSVTQNGDAASTRSGPGGELPGRAMDQRPIQREPAGPRLDASPEQRVVSEAGRERAPINLDVAELTREAGLATARAGHNRSPSARNAAVNEAAQLAARLDAGLQVSGASSAPGNLATATHPSALPAAAGQTFEHIAWMGRQGRSEARLQLHPAELGKVDIRLQVEGKEARVHLSVQQAAVREALEQLLPRLRETLAGQGIELTDATVDDSSQQQPEDSRQQFASHSGSTASENDASDSRDGDSPSLARQHQGLLDAYA
jgi:hypothetical protein